MRGFTLLESILVIGIIGVLASFILPIGFHFYQSQQLEIQAQTLLQTLRRAQLSSISMELDSSFGVYIAANNYVLFQGASYFSRDPQYDEVFDLPEIINASGLSEVIFLKSEGKPSIAGNIILRTDDLEKIININEVGRVNLQ